MEKPWQIYSCPSLYLPTNLSTFSYFDEQICSGLPYHFRVPNPTAAGIRLSPTMIWKVYADKKKNCVLSSICVEKNQGRGLGSTASFPKSSLRSDSYICMDFNLKHGRQRTTTTTFLQIRVEKNWNIFQA